MCCRSGFRGHWRIRGGRRCMDNGHENAADCPVGAELADLGLSPGVLLVPLRGIYAYLAYGRLEQCRAVPPDRRDPALAAARQAVAVLRKAASSTLLRVARNLG